MTPLEANEEARVALANAKWNGEKARIESGVLECLLVTAEREAKLREAIETSIEDLIDGDAFVIDRLRAALESDSKGGES